MSDILSGNRVSLSIAIDGVPIPGAERLELWQCGHFSADRFRVLLAIGALPDGAAFYAGLQAGTVTIRVNVGDPALVGQIDNVTLDFSAGHVVLAGRDLSARLIDAEIGQVFSNQTASEIAQGFAVDVGLVANVTATTTPVGQYYELAHVHTGLGAHTRYMTRWDLLASLAGIERFSLSVTGEMLNFGPAAQVAPVVLTYRRDLLALSVDRALGLVAPKVTAKSWSPKLKQAFTGSAGSTGGITLIRPNLTQAEVDRLAEARQVELAMQAVLIRAAMPGELLLRPDSMVLLKGTDTELDGRYIVRTVERIVDMHEGFVQSFEAIRVV